MALKRWRVRAVRPLRRVFLVVGGLLVAAEVIWHESFADWYLGLATGGLVGLWVALADSPPAHVENWQRGAEGERKTERVLRPLQAAGWTFAHDIDTPTGNRDHVGVGPAGVFLFETKRPGGQVTVAGDRVRVHRLDDPDDGYDASRWSRRIRGEAIRMRDEILAATGRRVFVQAVVVIWAPFPQRAAQFNRVAYVQGDALAGWLGSRRESLNPQACNAITAAIVRAGTTPATAYR